MNDKVDEHQQMLYSQAEEMLEGMGAEELADLLGYIESLEEQIRLNSGEPACTVSTFMRGPGGAEVLTAIKSPSEIRAWERLNTFVRARIKEGYSPVMKYPALSQAPAPAGSSTSAPTPAPTPAKSQAPKSPAPSSTNARISISKMEVTPLPDNRATLLLYAEGHRWPDLKVNNWPVDRLVELLSPTGAWEEEHLTTAQSYSVDFTAEWEHSDKVSASGKPYKNVTALIPNN